MVRQPERDLPELLAFFHLPRHLWKKLRTTNIIERCFVEVRRRPAPWCALLTCRVSNASSTPSSSALTWSGKPAPSAYLHNQLDVTLITFESRPKDIRQPLSDMQRSQRFLDWG
jgi:hypothetical protein